MTSPLAGAQIVGSPVMVSLDAVRPNDWNPNEMTDEVRASLLHGFKHEGWLASQPLLVWRTDKRGADVGSIIIDGEHRWRVAREAGFVEGPVVFLDGVSLAKAKALTIAMNQRRGVFDEAKLGELLRSVQFDLADDAPLSTMLGLDEERVMQLLSDPEDGFVDAVLPVAPVAPAPTEDPEAPASSGAKPRPAPGVAPVETSTKVVQLFYRADQRAEYDRLVQSARLALGGIDPVEALLQVLHRAANPAPLPS